MIAHEAGRRTQLLVGIGVHFLNVGLLCRDYRAEEAEADLGAGRDVEHALAKGPLLELFLANALHQLENPRLGSLYTEQFRKLLIFIEGDHARVKLRNIEARRHIIDHVAY